jgi:hypothetical protein
MLPPPAPAGFYGNSQTDSFAEDSRAGSDYLAEICREWEGAALVGRWVHEVLTGTPPSPVYRCVKECHVTN